MKTYWVCCEECGKRLIQRTSSGIWIFKFGKNKEMQNSSPIVHMEIIGSIRMECIRRTCDHINELSFFPQSGKSRINQPLSG